MDIRHRCVNDVRGIVEEIEVRFPDDPHTTDSEIAKRIVDPFDWSLPILHDRIQVTVQHGWVTLSGEVDWHHEREAAEMAASKIAGVKGVKNLACAIAVAP